MILTESNDDSSLDRIPVNFWYFVPSPSPGSDLKSLSDRTRQSPPKRTTPRLPLSPSVECKHSHVTGPIPDGSTWYSSHLSLSRGPPGRVQPNGSNALSKMFGIGVVCICAGRGGCAGGGARAGRFVQLHGTAIALGGSLTSRLQNCQQCLPPGGRFELEGVSEVMSCGHATQKGFFVLYEPQFSNSRSDGEVLFVTHLAQDAHVVKKTEEVEV